MEGEEEKKWPQGIPRFSVWMMKWSRKSKQDTQEALQNLKGVHLSFDTSSLKGLQVIHMEMNLAFQEKVSRSRF